ncbi:MAG: MBL fold metallo-hydrolase [Deltaproteobacteria bacterium]|nr:MBL fold metallo-hydrolase [Deltaproteobacteria bacterium]
MKCWITKSGITIHRVVWGRCNCYLISNGDRFLLVDAGSKKSWKSLDRGIQSLGATKDSTISLVLTHCHFDHAENAAIFKKTYKASIIVHTSEADCLKHGDNPPISGAIFLTKILTGMAAGTGLLARLRYEPADYDVLVDEELALEPLGFPGFILHTPGHSPGSISVVIDNEAAIVGDAMFGVFSGSVFPPFADDTRSMVESWKKLLDTGCGIYLPAHGWERRRDVLERQYEKYRKVYDL